METRGIRNMNPCNIRRGSSKWEGLREEQTDPHFCQFTSMMYGLRAVFKLLQTYRTKYGAMTLEKIIYRWAPPTDDNDTENYLRQVTSFTGASATQLLADQRHDPELYKKLVYKMCWVESCYCPTWWELEAAFLMANP